MRLPGSRTVEIGTPVVNKCDIIEYARELLLAHPWRQGQRVPNTEEWDVVAKNGLSLHDAIGMACYRLSGEVGTKATPPRPASSSKDFPVGTKAQEFGYMSDLRKATTAAIEKHIPVTSKVPVGSGRDIKFNDAAKNVTEVIELLDKVIKEECRGGK